MTRRHVILFCIAFVLVALSACQRLQDARPLQSAGLGDLPTEPMKFLDAVPAEFGDLISVTSRSDYPAWAQAWFMRSDRSIVVLWINSQTGKMIDRALIIPRR